MIGKTGGTILGAIVGLVVMALFLALTVAMMGAAEWLSDAFSMSADSAAAIVFLAFIALCFAVGGAAIGRLEANHRAWMRDFYRKDRDR